MASPGRSPLLAAAVLALAACGEHPGTMIDDGGSDAPAVDAPAFTPTAPAAAAAPRLAPCPAGWREVVADDGVSIECDPWPAGGPSDCPVGEAHFPGEPGCVTLGRACPAGEWPDDLPVSEVIYVSATAAPAGDGTRASPFATVAEAVAAAPTGATLVLGRGTHIGPVRPDRDLTVRGACAAETTLAAVRSGLAISMRGGVRLRVEDMTLAAGSSAAVLSLGSHLELEGVRVTGGGVSVSSGSMGVREASFEELSLDMEHAVNVSGAEDVLIERVVVSGGPAGGIVATDAVAGAIRDVAVRDTGATALFASSSGSLSIERAVIDRSADIGVILNGGALDLADVVVRDTIAGTLLGADGLGVQIAPGATARIARLRVERAKGVAILAAGPATDAALEDVVIRNTLPEEGGARFGRGLELGDGATVTLERVLADGGRDIALLARGPATMVQGTDVILRDTESDERGIFGRGLHAQTGARVALERVQLTGNREASVTAASAGTSVQLLDAEVLDTRVRGCAETTCVGAGAGIGISTRTDATIEVERFLLSGHALCGVQLAGDGAATLRDGVVSNNPIGANVQTASFDISRITTDVLYRDNGVNLDSSELAVPDSDAATSRR